MSSSVARIDGLRVAKARLALPPENGRHVSQQKLANRAGMHVVTLSNIERGAVTNTTVETLGKLSRALKVEISDLLASEDEKEADPAVRVRRLRAELVLAGRDDLAEELNWLAGYAGLNRALADAELTRP